jgi:hypothetical protein
MGASTRPRLREVLDDENLAKTSEALIGGIRHAISLGRNTVSIDVALTAPARLRAT